MHNIHIQNFGKNLALGAYTESCQVDITSCPSAQYTPYFTQRSDQTFAIYLSIQKSGIYQKYLYHQHTKLVNKVNTELNTRKITSVYCDSLCNTTS